MLGADSYSGGNAKMAHRGLLAAVLRQSRIAARERERADRAMVRERIANARRADQTQREAERVQAASLRWNAAEQKRMEKAALEAHHAAMESRAEEQNLELGEVYADIDSLLTATLQVDDYFDLETLRKSPDYPPFDRRDLESPLPVPELVVEPAEPVLRRPDPPRGLAKLFGKGRHAKAVSAAEAAHARAMTQWQSTLKEVAKRRQDALDEHALRESARLAELENARARYRLVCAGCDEEVKEFNRQLDELIANLSYGTVDAVHEYISIVLENSLYPEHFPVQHEFKFAPDAAELRLRVLVPGPDTLPTIKSYKYSKSADEVTAIDNSQKACRDRYASAIDQVALRSLHEIFEADRRGVIKSISLEVGAQALDRATGLQTYVPFVSVGVERDAFLGLNLSAVIPELTLQRMGAAVSRNPYGLVPAKVTGVRRA
jgi:restriction system protein